MPTGRIISDPAIQAGLPCVRGTRVTVDALAGLRERGFSVEDILEDYPDLTADDVLAAWAYDDEARG